MTLLLADKCAPVGSYDGQPGIPEEAPETGSAACSRGGPPTAWDRLKLA